MERSARGQSRLPRCGASLKLLRLPGFRRKRSENSRFPALTGGRYAKARILIIVFHQVLHEPLREMYNRRCKKVILSELH